jgi:predicted membrane-bound spermidine synthase
VLIAAFVGIGVGFAFHHHVADAASPRLFHGAALLLALLVALVTILHPAVPGFGSQQADLGGDLYFTAAPARQAVASAALFALWFLSVGAIFALVSQRTAKQFRRYAPLQAYTLDIAGSCAGVLAFMAASWLQLPAGVWLLALAALFALAAERPASRPSLLSLGGLGLAALLSAHQDTRLLARPDQEGELVVRWSPYQKIEYLREPDGERTIFVNGIQHQHLESAGSLRALPAGIPYAVPYQARGRRPELPPYRSVLVLGAGSGNDVAAALLSGAEHVDAVEIDPVIAELGRQRHPARPYADPRVALTIDDGRAFLTRSRRQYDLIVFALTDSLVKVSPLAQLRLENYLFTEEAVRAASRRLSADGDLVFYNFYRQPWVPAKIERMVQRAIGRYPVRLYARKDFVMLAAGAHNASDPPPEPAGFDTATDDWPFLYLRRRGIPAVYLAAMLAVTLAVAGLLLWEQRLARRAGPPGPRSALASKLAFLFMGMAFLLLETKSVVQFSLLFGTTWLNNSLVFLAVLSLVLAANRLAARLPGSWLGVSFLALMASCAVALVSPLANLLAIESVLARFAAASLLTFSPIFFANLIFSLAFRAQEAPEHVFGWNLMGATLGGAFEYVSLAIGYRALAAVVAACYAVAFAAILAARARLRAG